MRLRVMRWVGLSYFGLMLTVLPYPTSISWIVPPWLLILLVYMMAVEQLVWGLGSMVVIGYLMDVMLVNCLGAHLLAFSMSLWSIALKRDRFLYLAVPQQAIWIIGIGLLYGSSFYGFEMMMGSALEWRMIGKVVLQAMMGGYCWLWVQPVLDRALPRVRASFNQVL